MAYVAWSVVFGETPSASKWNILGTNDQGFNDGTAIGAGVIGNSQVATGVLVQCITSVTSAFATGTTLIPQDDTIPQNTEGDQYMSVTITPKASTNLLVIQAVTFMSFSVTADLMAALFQDSTANALAMSTHYGSVATEMISLAMAHAQTAGTVAATTFKVRAGGHFAGTTTFNGQSSARQFGASNKSFLMVSEYKV